MAHPPVLLIDGQPVAVAVDGKAMAGALDADGRAAFLLAAVTHTATSVLAQRQIGPKSNEIPSFAPLLSPLDLAGVVVTMDSLHTQRAHARFLLQDKHAHFVMIVKENQARLFDALAWTQVEIAHRTDERGLGRREVPTIQVMDAPTAWMPCNNAGSSRIPSRLAHRARPFQQSWADPTLSRLLPPSPAIPGSSCLQLHLTATEGTARRWWPSTSIRTNQRLVAHCGW
ncbi:transposase [Nonomuraea turkmeniaca]|uniref:Transposase n=1 Tax=Nonomuraea turkmeniaca TaxID=103838 RepID=A0A5S4FKT8_9ACTN|nr:transposase [Nonomuraea turkmeniaca]TMR21346.1 transposase [Nonomuraea turkmeniaca]